MKVTVSVSNQPKGALIEVFGAGYVPNGDTIELSEEQEEVYRALTGLGTNEDGNRIDIDDLEIVVGDGPVEGSEWAADDANMGVLRVHSAEDNFGLEEASMPEAPPTDADTEQVDTTEGVPE